MSMLYSFSCMVTFRYVYLIVTYIAKYIYKCVTYHMYLYVVKNYHHNLEYGYLCTYMHMQIIKIPHMYYIASLRLMKLRFRGLKILK